MVKLRIATKEDGAALAAIYAYYVENTAVTFEYVAPSAEEFGERIAHKLEKYPYIIAEENGRTVGYAYADMYRERAAFNWSCELSVYLDKNETGKGTGKLLYNALIAILKLQGFVSVVASITYPNGPSVALHKKMGFSHLGTMHDIGYKFGRWLDLMWFEKRISDVNTPATVIPFPELDSEKISAILEKFTY
ncbi:MAG: N-acetyltransferase [Clostridia bacterium]|nr:N-acetyltransferase [Clostridia bacterium]